MSAYAIIADFLLIDNRLEHDHAVIIEDGRILSVPPAASLPADLPRISLPPGQILAPGFVDLQVNGGGGVLFNDTMTLPGLAAIVAAHRQGGTTALLPTLISGSRAQIAAAMDVVAAALHAGLLGVIGLHLEGPFLNPARRGIHPQAAILPFTESDLALLTREFPGVLAITLAPECVPLAAIRHLAAAGIRVFLGHTNASYEQATAALDAGACGFTHVFNAMSPLAARAPGAVGAALAWPDAWAGLILDGLHVHPASARLAQLAKPGRLFLVSDAMPSIGDHNLGSGDAGSGQIAFRLGGADIHLHQGRLTSADGTLAGAHLHLGMALRHAVGMLGITPAEALALVGAAPAACLGRADLGRIAPGARADLVALDAQLRVVRSWVGGAA